MTEGAEVKYLTNEKSKTRDLIILQSPYVYRPSTKHFEVGASKIPAGFQTDNASMPDWIGPITATASGVLCILLFGFLTIFMHVFFAAVVAICIAPFLFYTLYIHPNDKRVRRASWWHDYVWSNKEWFKIRYLYNDEELRLYSNIEMRECCIADGMPLIKSWEIYITLQYSSAALKVWKSL